MTKATDLKTIFLKSICKMDVETCVTLCFKQKKIFFTFFLPFFGTFLQPSLAPKL